MACLAGICLCCCAEGALKCLVFGLTSAHLFSFHQKFAIACSERAPKCYLCNNISVAQAARARPQNLFSPTVILPFPLFLV
ncbi:hypothetical protein BDZ97DRAFT_1782061 [Flammula alnicola]|nr:hypothetical protein BDZ97DRAFT_1782061 [Flammula alnicola]